MVYRQYHYHLLTGVLEKLFSVRLAGLSAEDRERHLLGFCKLAFGHYEELPMGYRRLGSGNQLQVACSGNDKFHCNSIVCFNGRSQQPPRTCGRSPRPHCPVRSPGFPCELSPGRHWRGYPAPHGTAWRAASSCPPAPAWWSLSVSYTHLIVLSLDCFHKPGVWIFLRCFGCVVRFPLAEQMKVVGQDTKGMVPVLSLIHI